MNLPPPPLPLVMSRFTALAPAATTGWVWAAGVTRELERSHVAWLKRAFLQKTQLSLVPSFRANIARLDRWRNEMRAWSDTEWSRGNSKRTGGFDWRRLRDARASAGCLSEACTQTRSRLTGKPTGHPRRDWSALWTDGFPPMPVCYKVDLTYREDASWWYTSRGHEKPAHLPMFLCLSSSLQALFNGGHWGTVLVVAAVTVGHFYATLVTHNGEWSHDEQERGNKKT